MATAWQLQNDDCTRQPAGKINAGNEAAILKAGRGAFSAVYDFPRSPPCLVINTLPPPPTRLSGIPLRL